jgi:5-methylcytosine-specific restriction enzyme A
MKWRELDARRGNSSERGYDATWQKFRRVFLCRHPLCADCEADGRLTSATEVHHIEKIADNPARRLDPSNCLGLCKACHSKRTLKGE